MESWTPEYWQRIDAVLDVILELSGSEREAQLTQACAGDEKLAADVRKFLVASERSATFMAQPAGETAAGLIAAGAETWQPESRLGQTLGPYELTEILGEGGMGVVYGARRSDGQYEAEVAIKLMLAISADHPLRDRFLAERQILARLDHPGIARLFDGGLDSEGHPYIVMEKVLGRTLLEHCAEAGLNERLDIFAEVCSVVAAAHRRLVLHCDLKPSNILVTAEGDLKLLDFGLARGLEIDGDSDDSDLRCKMFTPGYASPEQLRGEPLSMASDVYSLGVLLRDLLEGPHSWAQQLAGDLGNILARATAENAEERYDTAHELADDLRRYRARLPVEATPSTPWYRFSRLVDRNRGATFALGLVLTLILVGVSATLWQARIASVERDVAQQEAARSAAVTDFLVGLFESSDPANNKGADVTAREVLDRGAEEVAELSAQPRLQAQLQYVLGDVFYSVGEFQRSVDLYQASLQSRLAYASATSREVSNNQLALAVAMLDAGQHEAAEAQLQACLATRRQDPIESFWLTTPLRALARLRMNQDNYEAAITLFEEAQDLDLANTEVDFEDRGRAYHNFAAALRNVGRHAEADAAYDVAEEAYLKVLPADHPYFGALYNNWALLVSELGDNDRAEILLRRALELRRRLKHNRVDIGTTLTNLGNLLATTGRPDEAVPLLEEAVAIQREAFGTGHLYVGAAVINLGTARQAQGQPALADVHFQEGYEIFVGLFGTESPAVAIALTKRAEAARAMGDLPQALVFLDRSINTHRPLLPSYHVRFANAVQERGRVYAELGQTEKARTDLEEAAAIYGEMFADDHPDVVKVREELAALPR